MSEEIPIPVTCLGLNYRTASIGLREGLCFTTESLAQTLSQFRRRLTGKGVDELVILSTCNRVELYAVASDSDSPDAAAKCTRLLTDFLAQIHGLPSSRITGHLYHYHSGKEAAQHLCRVASGLDSMIVGEPQILGQVTEAYTLAQAQRTVGPALTTLFQRAIRCGKRARSETNIGRNAASVGSAAVKLAQDGVGDLRQSRVLVVGAGEMGRLTLKALQQRGTQQIDVVNRTYQRAAEIAARWGGQAHDFSQLIPLMTRADVVVSSTAAPHPIIDVATLQQVMADRDQQPLVLIDIAVPRDVVPEAADIPGIRLFDVDALQNRVDSAVRERRHEIPRVEAIIAHEMEELKTEFQELTVRPLIVDLRLRAEVIRQYELDRARRFMSDLDGDEWEHVERMSRAIVNKLLHEPTIRLRAEAGNGRSAAYEETVRHLFGLEEDPS